MRPKEGRSRCPVLGWSRVKGFSLLALWFQKPPKTITDPCENPDVGTNRQPTNYNELAAVIEPLIGRLIMFAKNVPGFSLVSCVLSWCFKASRSSMVPIWTNYSHDSVVVSVHGHLSVNFMPSTTFWLPKIRVYYEGTADIVLIVTK